MAAEAKESRHGDARNGEETSGAPFRTVLPHEPVPAERPGRILIQGAFTPKSVVAKKRNGGKDEEDGDKSSGTKEEKSQLMDRFWSAEDLKTELVNRLNVIVSSPTLSNPFCGASVLDAAPPFTKVTVECASSDLAHRLLAVLRKREVCPRSVFEGFEARNDSSTPVAFGSRPFQLSLLTCQPLPPLDRAWNRSNPPKFRRLLPRPGEDPAALDEERRQTRFVFVSNVLPATTSDSASTDEQECWRDPHCVSEAIRNVVNGYDTSGLGAEVFVAHNRLRHCHVGMRSPRDARALLEGLQGAVVTLTTTELGTVHQHSTTSGRLFLDYAAITNRSVAKAQARSVGGEPEKGEPPRSECTSVTDDVVVPGLSLIPDFVSEEEEAALMAVLTGPQAPWAPSQRTPTGGVVKRKVQHYGYVFDYATANVLRDRVMAGADCPPLPAIPPAPSADESTNNAYVEEAARSAVEDGDGWTALACVVERARYYSFADGDSSTPVAFPHLNQLTVNFYQPGEGIGSHVDTPSAFGDGLISISLHGGIVMEFRKVSTSGDRDEKSKKLVYLPPRSLLLMSGAARYDWEHVIVTRQTDTVNGTVLPRQLRVSLTLRTALTAGGQPMPLVTSALFPPTWGSMLTELRNPLRTPDCERDHVHRVYDVIAEQWHHTRGRRGVLWPGATQFLRRLPPGSIVADVGCGDGKYFPAIWEAGSYVIGTDISIPLLKTALSCKEDDDEVPEIRRVGPERTHLRERPAVAAADCMSVPIRSGSCDAAICIAVLHHISTLSRRIRCIEELARIVKPGGSINIQAWARDQEESSRHKFASNDIFVPFNVQPKYLAMGDVVAVATDNESDTSERIKSTAERYSEAFNAEYDDQKGLVVFKRYCHLYKEGELESLCSQVPNVAIVDSGFETGNYFVILEVVR